ncbi:3'-5' exonuclease [Acinetobacter sp. HY1485]|uniref:3'-5' exonuclease n=1 Tax=Acinetobacter sp. HY1485 TaxID=2970918 RepID=UPI0022B9929D|nr:3'-5' exonuclease [Acinetobacter sp. HY1485]
MRLPVFVFDIETITDLKAGAHLYQLNNLNDDDKTQALNKIRRQDSGSDFQRLPLHQIACISGFWIDEKGMRLFSLSQKDNTEAEILEKFLSVFEKRQPVLVSWNGAQFDLPVILYRAMYHGLSAPSLLDQGEIDQQRRYNNYQNRYHHQHIDLMDALALFNGRNFQKLDDVAHMFGFAGKREGKGYQVPEQIKQQDWLGLTSYCEGNVLNTWFIYLRWLLLKGQLLREDHQDLIKSTQQYLATQPQHEGFLAQWQQSAQSTPFSQTFFD